MGGTENRKFIMLLFLATIMTLLSGITFYRSMTIPPSIRRHITSSDCKGVDEQFGKVFLNSLLYLHTSGQGW